ncbi:uncharacterized protein LOC119661834 [Teleopsis dalmanni]|uniref:uncharacterized protein LOC119661834 n=1 Tax=Teleopsis dalmanni TaxID=139649 RepID=UPI0018CD23EC|nr:uncharacterized protein LOC119661834 [Teleopsis dalmanni]
MESINKKFANLKHVKKQLHNRRMKKVGAVSVCNNGEFKIKLDIHPEGEEWTDLTDSSADSEDLAQEAFIQSMRKIRENVANHPEVEYLNNMFLESQKEWPMEISQPENREV